MMKKYSLIFAFLFACIGLNAQRGIEPPIPFKPLDQMSDVDRSTFLAEHYWSIFQFHDTTAIHREDGMGRRWLPNFFAQYLQMIRYADLPTIQRSLADVIKRADTNERMYRYFVEIFDFYLNDALSDMREEQWIEPVWRQMLQSRWATFSDSTRLNFLLKQADKNRVGSTATDLEFVTIQGQRGQLSKIEAEFILVYFYIPGCPQCTMTIEWIESDSAYQELIAAGILQGFAFYPEKDMNLFRSYRNSIPSTWINARDPDGMSQLEEDQKYQMRGAPTIYLLDRNKKIVLKDARLDLLFNEFEKARDRFLR
jgi:hypothetical protein